MARHGILPGDRALLVGDGAEVTAAEAALRAAGAGVVGPITTEALRSIGGRGPVAWARFVAPGGDAAVRRERVEIVVFGDRTPNLDLVLAAGGAVGWRDGRLTPEAGPDGQTSVPGLFVAGDAAGVAADATSMEAQARRAGAAAASWGAASTGPRAGRQTSPTAPPRTGDPPRSTSSGRPPAAGSPDAVLCFCEDVRGWEVRAELVAGYADPELVKRRTGALTGACQGKYCLSAISCAIGGGDGDAPSGDAPPSDAPPGDLHLPTGRPPLRPIRLRDLVAEDAPSATTPAATSAADHR